MYIVSRYRVQENVLQLSDTRRYYKKNDVKEKKKKKKVTKYRPHSISAALLLAAINSLSPKQYCLVHASSPDQNLINLANSKQETLKREKNSLKKKEKEIKTKRMTFR